MTVENNQNYRKKVSVDTIIILLYIILMCIIGLYYSNSNKNNIKNIENQLTGAVDFTGNVFITPIQSGSISTNTGENKIHLLSGESVKESEIDKFHKLLNNNSFIRKFYPPKQPIILSSMNYEERSKLLNSYLKDNNYYFKNSQNIDDGYLYLKLHKGIDNGDVFLYFHNTRLDGYIISGKLDKSSNLGNESEFLYKLNSVVLHKYFDGKLISYDWLGTEINIMNKVHYVGGYLTTADGNYIEEIIIVGV